MERALQAILIAGEKARDDILLGVKKITVRRGYRDYSPGPVILCCHILNWAVMKQITSVRYTNLGNVYASEFIDDGFGSSKAFFDAMKQFYPDITMDSPVTIVRWE